MNRRNDRALIPSLHFHSGDGGFFHVLQIARVANCSCCKLHMLQIARVANSMCYTFHMFQIACVTNCMCCKMHAFQSVHVVMLHVAKCTCCKVPIFQRACFAKSTRFKVYMLHSPYVAKFTCFKVHGLQSAHVAKCKKSMKTLGNLSNLNKEIHWTKIIQEISQIRNSLNCRKETIYGFKLDEFFRVLDDLLPRMGTSSNKPKEWQDTHLSHT